MKRAPLPCVVASLLLALLSISGCGKKDSDSTGERRAYEGEDTANSELPPRGPDALDAWLAAGHYKNWSCEAEGHAARSPSPHGANRICSNQALAAATADTLPSGSASVKELIDAAGAVTGYAVSRRLGAAAGADQWYWYEAIGTSVAAEGHGGEAETKDKCVGCHAAAGTDAAHSGRDHVYTINAAAASDPELPPEKSAALVQWLEAGSYKDWACEPEPTADRVFSAHGTTRVCSNAKLSQAGNTGTYPVGAATVKEIYKEGAISLYAVMTKVVADATGDSWFFFEGSLAGTAEGQRGHPSCTTCHAKAGTDPGHPGRDYIFTQITAP